MAVLYIANTTKQHHRFFYRLPGSNELRNQEIPVGSQQRIGNRDLPNDAIAEIVRQHERYGMVDVKKLGSTRGFVGLCYSIGTPIQLEHFGAALKQNAEVIDERAAERREEAVAALTKTLEETLEQPTQRVEVETIEDTLTTPRIAEGIEVSRDSRSRHGAKRGRKAAASAESS